MNKKNRCTQCKRYFPSDEMIITNVGKFHNEECRKEYSRSDKAIGKAISYAKKQQQFKDREDKRKAKAQEKAEKTAHQNRKKDVKPIKWWQDTLQALVNQFVMQVRDKGMSCCTCASPDANECGHWHSRGARPDIRYNLKNLAPQCHSCNVYKSGNKAEYDKYIVERWGVDVFDDLNMQQQTLKDQLPHWSDYEVEIKRYRGLLREAGVKPCR